MARGQGAVGTAWSPSPRPAARGARRPASAWSLGLSSWKASLRGAGPVFNEGKVGSLRCGRKAAECARPATDQNPEPPEARSRARVIKGSGKPSWTTPTFHSRTLKPGRSAARAASPPPPPGGEKRRHCAAVRPRNSLWAEDPKEKKQKNIRRENGSLWVLFLFFFLHKLALSKGGHTWSP